MNNKNFEKRVKILMLLHDDTITSLAKKICIDEATLGKYIHGRRNPPIRILEDIADEYGVSVDFVLGRHGHFAAIDELQVKDFYDNPNFEFEMR